MVLPIAIPLAMSAIKALVRFRGRVDEILSLKEASAGLPFALPPTPTDDLPHIPRMVQFFQSDAGRLVLEMKGMTGEFETYSAAPSAPQSQPLRVRLCALYYEAAEIAPEPLGPGSPPATAANTGPSAEMRLAYYVVESHRLSRNPALTRLLLVTADTMLEVAGENVGLVVSDPRKRAIVETLLEEFAVKRDFDDDAAEDIFKRLLTSAAVAVLENGDKLSNQPALTALFRSIADVREDVGEDFLVGLLSRDGFQTLVSKYLTHVADDPSFVTKNELASKVLSATLREVGTKLPRIVDDPKALLGVLEVTLTVGAANVQGLLERELGNKPLLTAVLGEMTNEIVRLGQSNGLFSSIATGDIVSGLYQSALSAIAEDPDRLAGDTGMGSLVSGLVAGFADVLSQREIGEAFKGDTLRSLAQRSLALLADHAPTLARDHDFATKLLGDVLRAGALAVKDGFSVEDILSVADQAFRTTAENAALWGAKPVVGAAFGAVMTGLGGGALSTLLTSQGRKDALLATLNAVAANPMMWEKLHNGNLIQPIVQSVFRALEADPTRLLSGTVLVDAVGRILAVLTRRAGALVTQKVEAPAIQAILKAALAMAEKESGKTLDGENLPQFLERVLLAFLKTPVALSNADAVKKLLLKALKSLDSE